MTSQTQRDAHLKDTLDLYDAIEDGTLPAVSFVSRAPSNDGHPSSSRLDLFESFTRDHRPGEVPEEPLESAAILVTVDEGGGYYDSGYVSRSTYFGDGTETAHMLCRIFARRARLA